ncbi:MAG: hypothetical protein ABII18_03500 [bacterium]|nr:hypothetical protein [bacterium]MBU1918190.1 hypothetical protein [bacterium]
MFSQIYDHAVLSTEDEAHVFTCSQAMKTAKYLPAQRETQKKVYEKVLAEFALKPDEVLLDWGANTGALGYVAIEKSMDHFHYVPIDASFKAIRSIEENLEKKFTGLVTPIQGKELFGLKKDSVDYIAALGSLTHWPGRITDVEDHFIEIAAYLAGVAKKGVAISFYSKKIFKKATAVLALASIVFSLDHLAMTFLGWDPSFAYFAFWQLMISLLLISVNNQFLFRLFMKLFFRQKLGLNIYYMDGEKIRQRLKNKGLNVRLESLAKKQDGPFDLLFIQK